MKYVSATEASLFASISEVEGVPKIQMSFIKYESAANPFWGQPLSMLKSGHIPMDRALGVMLLAKGGHWDVEGQGLKVRYEGGSAIFAAKAGTPKIELLRAADVFNAISQAAQTVGSDRLFQEQAPPKKPAFEKPSGSIRGGSAVATPSPADQQSAPAFDKLK